MDVPLFIHRISSFCLSKGHCPPPLPSQGPGGYGQTRSVSGACPCPHHPLMVWYIQLISVRDPLPPSQLPRSPAGSCAPSFQEGDAPRERGAVPQGWCICSGKRGCHLVSWSLPAGLTSPLISRVPFAGNSTSLSG